MRGPLLKSDCFSLCEDGKKICHSGSPFLITRLAQMMTSGDSEQWIFLYHPYTHDRFLEYNTSLKCRVMSMLVICYIGTSRRLKTQGQNFFCHTSILSYNKFNKFNIY